MILFMALIVVAMAWWANASKRNKIYCSFTRVNKTSIHKFVRMSSRYVVFDNQRYDIVPSCIVFDWWTNGIIHMLFPQWVATLDFTYSSRWPIDKLTGKPAVISPEVRKNMNKEEWVKSYARGFTPPAAKKQTAIQQWLPYVAIIAVALVAVYMFVNIQAIQKDLVNLYNAINSIAK